MISNVASAARKVLSGKANVSKFLQALYGKYFPEGATYTFTTLNSRPAIVFRFGGQVYRCMVFEIREGVIMGIYILVNPDKLHGL